MTTSASIDVSSPVALRGIDHHGRAGAVARLALAGHRLASVGGAVAQWFRAGQLGADPGVQVGRWSGARC